MKLPKALKKLNKDDNLNFPRGAECVFVSCDNGWGMKLYGVEATRDAGFFTQQKLNKLYLAPKVGKVFTAEISHEDATHLSVDQSKCGKKSIVYGYMSEEADIVQFPSSPRDQVRLNQLYDKLKKVGYTFRDNGIRNVGYIGKKLVIIDCNPLSFD